MKFHIPFKNDEDRITLARQVVVDSMLRSLEDDIKECLRYQYDRTSEPTSAYSPALIYWFSKIEWLCSVNGRAIARNVLQAYQLLMEVYL